jgi:hypothetical protein
VAVDIKAELPFLAAGGVAITGATIRDGHLPPMGKVVIATLFTVLVASASDNTKLAPLVHAFGMLVLLVTVMAATNVVIRKRKGGK